MELFYCYRVVYSLVFGLLVVLLLKESLSTLAGKKSLFCDSQIIYCVSSVHWKSQTPPNWGKEHYIPRWSNMLLELFPYSTEKYCYIVNLLSLKSLKLIRATTGLRIHSTVKHCNFKNDRDFFRIRSVNSKPIFLFLG